MTNFIWYAGASGNTGLLTAALNLQTTELQSLANGSLALSSVINGTGIASVADTGGGVWADIFINVGNPGMTGTLATGAVFSGWFITSFDGTVFEQTSTTTAPPRSPDFIIPAPTATVAALTTWKSSGPVLLPALKFKTLIQNLTGQTFGTGATTAPYLKLAAYALQY